jgi:hypothetical protein
MQGAAVSSAAVALAKAAFWDWGTDFKQKETKLAKICRRAEFCDAGGSQVEQQFKPAGFYRNEMMKNRAGLQATGSLLPKLRTDHSTLSA